MAYARRRTKEGGLRNDLIKWEAPSGITLDTDQGRNVKITVTPSALAESKITVRIGRKSDVLRIHVVTPSGDQARANRTDISSVVAMFGNGSGCPNDSTFTFVGVANLGSWKSSCVNTHVITFTDYQAPYKWAGPWQDPTNDAVDATSIYPQQNVQQVRFWYLDLGDLSFASDPPNPPPAPAVFANDFIATRLAAATGIYTNNRAGLTFELHAPIKYLASNAVTCDEVVDYITGGGTTPDPNRWDSTRINVYLVADAATGSRAQLCWNYETDPVWRKNVIRIQTRALNNTLAHEFGHALGLYVPWGPLGKYVGHTGDLNGFAVDNLMYAGVDASSTSARTRLSLGQVYRMHFDQRSWLGGGRNCHCDPYGSTCGRLSRDVRSLKNDNGVLDAQSLTNCPP